MGGEQQPRMNTEGHRCDFPQRRELLTQKNSAVTVVVVLLLSLAPLGDSQDKWEQAEREIKRLPPSAFTKLPVAVVKQLEAHGCAIPQVLDKPEPHNVIRGRFARKSQIDWAVLCSKKGNSSILVFPAKPNKCLTELATADDRSFLQKIGQGQIGYSRMITAVGWDYILEHYKRYGGPIPPPLDHEGINDAFVGKASVVRYCWKARWFTLTGAD